MCMIMEQRDSVVGTLECNNQNWEDYMKEGKAFQISQNEVLNAYKAVKANKGVGGVDGIEFQEYDRDWKTDCMSCGTGCPLEAIIQNPSKELKFQRKMGKRGF